jgi:hypothetical protein
VQAQAVVPYVSANNLGQALICPYYTVRDGWRTFVHVTNTSANTVATRVRFRAARESEDVLDFVLVLSPFDMWTAVVEERGGAPGVRPTDNSCTVPIIGSGNFVPFRVTDLNAPQEVNKLREGYVEIFQMGVALDEDQPVAIAATHGTDGQPANCAAVVTAFSTPANVVTTRAQFGPLENVLAGKFDLINVPRAASGAARAVAIADFSPVDTSLIFGQFQPQWYYPDLATAAEADGGGAAADRQTQLEAVHDALNAEAISNEWVLNPGLGELSSWVVTFPTKHFGFLAPTRVPAETAGLLPEEVGVFIDLWNREEKTTTAEVDFSPGGVAPNTLDYEVNVINFVGGGQTSAGLLNSVVSKEINVDVLASPFLGGWARLSRSDSTSTSLTYLPAIGFNLTSRASPGDAVLYSHNYEGRPQVPGVVPPPAP